jgi:pimeloyl-ACP methyl ester carboxylesterase
MATYVLIPGAGGDGRYWYRVVRELEARGHTAIPVTLPAGDDNAGWAEYADAIEQAIDAAKGRSAGVQSELVLVAQSLAGFSAPIVATRRQTNLIALLNAMIPNPGETGEAWWSNTRSKEAQTEYFARIGLEPESADDDQVIYFHDVPPEVAEEAFGGQEPAQSWTPMTQPWPLPKWPNVPTRVLAGREDRLFPLDFQRRIARERLGLDADEVNGGHLLALSRPRELAERLEAYMPVATR